MRKATNITTTISSDIGEEPTYGTITSQQNHGTENYSLGKLLALLWFKKKLPNYFTQFLEKCVLLTADHGPAVSGRTMPLLRLEPGRMLFLPCAADC